MGPRSRSCCAANSRAISCMWPSSCSSSRWKRSNMLSSSAWSPAKFARTNDSNAAASPSSGRQNSTTWCKPTRTRAFCPSPYLATSSVCSLRMESLSCAAGAEVWAIRSSWGRDARKQRSRTARGVPETLWSCAPPRRPGRRWLPIPGWCRRLPSMRLLFVVTAMDGRLGRRIGERVANFGDFLGRKVGKRQVVLLAPLPHLLLGLPGLGFVDPRIAPQVNSLRGEGKPGAGLVDNRHHAQENVLADRRELREIPGHHVAEHFDVQPAVLERTEADAGGGR